MATDSPIGSASSSAVPNHWHSVRDHSRVFGQFTYVYPVVSRRSGGLSIGVNLNPDKACNFDCVYCEVDRRTPPKTRVLDLLKARAELCALVDGAMAGELEKDPKFAEAGPLTRTVRDIAFSGDGEPTMVHNFPECVRMVADVRRSRNLHDAKIVLITDAAGLDKASVREGLAIMDGNNGEIWAKLDAGTEAYYRAINRTSVSFQRILSNLAFTARERPIVVQSLFLKMNGQAMPLGELAAYCQRLREIVAAGGCIQEVHAYTIARPTPEPWVSRLEPAELEATASEIRRQTGLRVTSYP
jgi:wyosine [tRNA(Phe)-imidazoG37] synthetase (radical SAM superfamily)